MTIQQIIKELKELQEQYLINSQDEELSISTREYYKGKYQGISYTLRCLKYLDNE